MDQLNGNFSFENRKHELGFRRQAIVAPCLVRVLFHARLVRHKKKHKQQHISKRRHKIEIVF